MAASSTATLDPLAADAIARWALRGADAGALAAMRQAEWAIADLPAGQLGHLAGLDDLDSCAEGLMNAKLPTGIRRA